MMKELLSTCKGRACNFKGVDPFLGNSQQTLVFSANLLSIVALPKTNQWQCSGQSDFVFPFWQRFLKMRPDEVQAIKWHLFHQFYVCFLSYPTLAGGICRIFSCLVSWQGNFYLNATLTMVSRFAKPPYR